MQVLETDIAAFEQQKKSLEEHHKGKWVIFHEGNLVGVFDDFNAAASDAVSRFGRGPYLLRQVGAPAFTMPASLMYRIS
jgi:hypothetical protein